jgi:hypothetical protein
VSQRIDDEARDVMRDSFAHDMAEHQKATGKLPTPDANARLTVPIFEALEQKRAAQKATAEPSFDREPMPDDEAHAAAIRAEAARRGRPGAPDRLSIQRLPDKAPIALAADPADLERGLRMVRRLSLLLTKPEPGILGAPSWKQRAAAVLYLKFAGVDPRRTALELAELCEASIASFGPWDVPENEGRPLVFSQGGR